MERSESTVEGRGNLFLVAIAASIKEIVGLSPKILLVAPGSLPRSEGKIKRVIDNRRK